jgi:hypothetical protein
MSNLHPSRLRSRWQMARAALATMTALGSLLGANALPTQAADGTPYANTPILGVTQLTLPSPIWLPGALGGHLWVADNGLTFCRVDGPPNPTYGTYSVNASTCDTTAKSPAEAVLDPRPILDVLGNDTGKRYVYIADNSTKSQGAVRVMFDPSTETIVPGSGMVLGDGGTAGRTNSIALNPADGKLYIGHVKGGSIMRITGPNLDMYSQYTEIVGRTTDGRGVRGGMAFVCGTKAGTCDLYIGEVGGNGVSVMPDAQGCNPFGFGGCQATVTPITTNLPGGLTSDGNQFVFVGDAPLSLTGTVLRYNVFTDTQDIVSSAVPSYQATYPVAHSQTTYTGITGIAIDPSGNLYVGDDPTVNAALPPPLFQGKMWKIAGAYQSTTQCNAGATPPVTTACLDALGGPGNPAQITPPPSLAKPASLIAWGSTSPDGVVWMPGALGGHYWVADHTQGLCRLDPAPTNQGLSAANPLTCDPGGVTGSPGQPVFDPVGNFVYVPDAAVKSPGLWRLSFDPATETIGNPTLMAPGAGLDNDKLVGVAMGPDGNIYAAGLKNGFIYRVQNPRGDPTTMAVDIVGITSDNRGINGSMGILGNDLYLPENKGASIIKNVTGCATAANNFVPCTALRMNLPYIPFVLSAATDQQHGVVYFAVASGASNGTIYRFTPNTGATVVYATQGQLPAAVTTPGYVEDCTTMCQRKLDPGIPANGLVGFHFPLGMYVDSSGNLLLGDDIMAGVRGFHGHVFSVPYAQ